MKLKKILPPLLMLALMASFLIYYYYPHDLEDLVGSLELRIAHGAQVLLYRYYGNSYS